MNRKEFFINLYYTVVVAFKKFIYLNEFHKKKAYMISHF